MRALSEYRRVKIGYFGSPEISARLLAALIESGRHEIVFVVSNPDKPRGRSGTAHPTFVSAIALEKNIPLYRWPTLKDPEIVEELSRHKADLFFIFAYGRIIPRRIFDLPPERTMNLHASLLPELRGASPIQSAILRGFTETGWTIQYITEELDAGDILETCTVPVDPDATTADLTEKMMPAGIQLVLDTLGDLPARKTKRRAQDHDAASHCPKIDPVMARIDWTRSAKHIHNLVRAFVPWPGARTTYQGRELKIWQTSRTARPNPDSEKKLKEGPPGRFVVQGSAIFVAGGDGPLEILKLQPESRKAMSAADFVNGYRPVEGVLL